MCLIPTPNVVSTLMCRPLFGHIPALAVRFMMFGFGDELEPLQATVDLVEVGSLPLFNARSRSATVDAEPPSVHANAFQALRHAQGSASFSATGKAQLLRVRQTNVLLLTLSRLPDDTR